MPLLTTEEAAEIRQKAEGKISIAELSRRAGMGGSTLGNVLTGKFSIKEEKLEKLHKVLAEVDEVDQTVTVSTPEKPKPFRAKEHSLSELFGNGPTSEELLKRVEGKIEAVSERLANSIQENVGNAVHFNDRLEVLEQRARDIDKEAVQQLHEWVDRQTDIFDHFRKFEAAAREAARTDKHLFRATVSRVLAEVANG